MQLGKKKRNNKDAKAADSLQIFLKTCFSCFVCLLLIMTETQFFFFPSLPLFYFIWLYKNYAVNSVAANFTWLSAVNTCMMHGPEGILIEFNTSVPVM